MYIKFFSFLSITISFLILNNPYSMAMEEDPENESQAHAVLKKDKEQVLVDIVEDESANNSVVNDLNSALEKLVKGLPEGRVKIEEIDPKLIKNISIRYPQLKEGEPNLIFCILPKSLNITTEQRPQKSEPKQQTQNRADKIRKQLNNILYRANMEESTALLSYKKLPTDNGQPKWDDSATFMKALDDAFFNQPSSSIKVVVAQGGAGVLGLGAPIPICGAILYSIGNIFGFPSGDWLSDLLSVWITVNLTPVSTRQLYKESAELLKKSSFLTLKEDETITEKRTVEVTKKKKEELLNIKLKEKAENHQEIAISTEEQQEIQQEILQQARIQAQEEVGEPYRSNPHVFAKSNGHKTSDVALILSSIVNGSIPAYVVVLVYQEFDKLTGIPWGPMFAVPVGLHYALNYYDFGKERLWQLFSHYKYIGSGQASEEDSRQKRAILVKRIQQFQEVIADPKYSKYTSMVYNTIVEEKENLNTQNIDKKNLNINEEQISAFSLLMLMDKIRIEEDHGMNFKKDLDVIKVSFLEDLFDNLTAGIVGAGFYADVVIVRTILKEIFQSPPFSWDEVTAEEQSGFYALAFLDVSFRAAIEFKLHQNNFKSWLKVFSLKHLVDFQKLRKTLGGLSLINSILHSLPKFFVGWSAFSNETLLTKLALLVPSFLNNISLNDAVYNKHYNGQVTDIATLKKKASGVPFQRSYLKSWSDEAIRLIQTRFDDETVDKIYSGIHKGI